MSSRWVPRQEASERAEDKALSFYWKETLPRSPCRLCLISQRLRVCPMVPYVQGRLRVWAFNAMTCLTQLWFTPGAGRRSLQSKTLSTSWTKFNCLSGLKKQAWDRGLAVRQAAECACQNNSGTAARGSGCETRRFKFLGRGFSLATLGFLASSWWSLSLTFISSNRRFSQSYHVGWLMTFKMWEGRGSTSIHPNS